jgi:hypothetical protein
MGLSGLSGCFWMLQLCLYAYKVVAAPKLNFGGPRFSPILQDFTAEYYETSNLNISFTQLPTQLCPF